TIAATITVPRIIQQGEAIETKDDGKITVRFPDAYTIDIFPKSKLDFIQTLPSNFVISQEQGISEYTKTGATPLSIRSFHLLIQLNSGYIAITTDKDEKTVSVNVSSGSATLAYNDLQYISNVITIKAGKTFTFDDNTRTARITSNLQ
ncbi:MAG: hypothetical protein Q7R51_01790, partial [bacterium]|nr:hypothetical protein [bacterium]